MWQATLDDEVGRASEDFEMGRERELYLAERRRQAPALGGVWRCTRKALGMSLAEVAAAVEIEADQLERIELGEESRSAPCGTASRGPSPRGRPGGQPLSVVVLRA